MEQSEELLENRIVEKEREDRIRKMMTNSQGTTETGIVGEYSGTGGREKGFYHGKRNEAVPPKRTVMDGAHVDPYRTGGTLRKLDFGEEMDGSGRGPSMEYNGQKEVSNVRREWTVERSAGAEMGEITPVRTEISTEWNGVGTEIERIQDRNEISLLERKESIHTEEDVGLKYYRRDSEPYSEDKGSGSNEIGIGRNMNLRKVEYGGNIENGERAVHSKRERSGSSTFVNMTREDITRVDRRRAMETIEQEVLSTDDEEYHGIPDGGTKVKKNAELKKAGGIRKKRKVIRENRSGMQYTEREALCLAKAWVLQSQQLTQTVDRIWIGIEETCREKYGMTRSRESLRAKWAIVAQDCQLWNSCYRQAEKINQTGNISEKRLLKMTHALFQSRRRKEKETNPGIGINFKYLDAAKFLCSFPKFGHVDGDGGVTINRTGSSVGEVVRTDKLLTSNGHERFSGKREMLRGTNGMSSNDDTGIYSPNRDRHVGQVENSTDIHESPTSGSLGGSSAAFGGKFEQACRLVRSVDEVENVSVEEVGLSSSRRKMGVKAIKKCAAQKRMGDESSKVMEGIRDEMKKTNEIMASLNERQENSLKLERMYMALQFLPKGSEQYEKIVNEITEFGMK